MCRTLLNFFFTRCGILCSMKLTCRSTFYWLPPQTTKEQKNATEQQITFEIYFQHKISNISKCHVCRKYFATVFQCSLLDIKMKYIYCTFCKRLWFEDVWGLNFKSFTWNSSNVRLTTLDLFMLIGRTYVHNCLIHFDSESLNFGKIRGISSIDYWYTPICQCFFSFFLLFQTHAQTLEIPINWNLI